MTGINIQKPTSRIAVMTHLAAAITGVVLCMLTARTAVAAPAPILKIELKIAKDKVAFGEPIKIDYKVENVSGKWQTIQVPLNSDNWIDVRLLDAEGKTIARDRGVQGQSDEERSAPPRFEPWQLQGGDSNVIFAKSQPLGPDKPYLGTSIISRRLAIPRPGEYTLIARAAIPVNQVGGGETLVRANLTVPIKVGPPDPKAIAKYADDLASKVRIASRGEHGDMASVWAAGDARRELISLPGQYAERAWTAIAQDQGMDPGQRGRFLASLINTGSSDMIDFLGHLKWSGSEPTDLRDALARLYYHGTPAMQQQIRSLYQNHGQPLPTAPPETYD